MSTKKLFVGNLPFSATSDEVRDLFAAHGTVHEVNLLSDRETGRPRGFGFVEMDEAGATAAMQALNGVDFGGRDLRVNEANERPRSSSGGGRREFGGSGGGKRRF
jgi:RNA recognition motif-containing protein